MAPLEGLRIFTVEDEAFIGLMLHDMLVDLGCRVIGTAITKSDALRMIETRRQEIDAVTLDINLGGENGQDVAALLSGFGIPFVVTTGYDDPIKLSGFEQHPIVYKPFMREDLERALKALVMRT
jgi:CheY-like chemotaxis protein